MPMNRKLYPANWEAIALEVKEAAGWKCQECSKECRRAGESLIDFIERIFGGNLRDNDWTAIADHPKKWEMSVAHLDHCPENCDRSNLRAWCSVCHCRYDLKAMALKRRLKQERNGQLNLLAGVDNA